MSRDLGTSPRLVGVALSWFRVVQTYDADLEIQRLAMPNLKAASTSTVSLNLDYTQQN
jgi:hypothetical protein